MTPGRRHRGERGSAAVEFALIVPFFFLLIFGTIDFGYMVNRSSLINNAARDAVRLASLHASEAEIRATAMAAVSDLGTATVIVSCKKVDGSACVDYDADKESRGMATVTITYKHQMLTPVGMLVPGGFDLGRKAEMRIE